MDYATINPIREFTCKAPGCTLLVQTRTKTQLYCKQCGPRINAEKATARSRKKAEARKGKE